MKKKHSLAFLLIFTILTSLCGCSASAITVREKRASEAMQKAESFWAEQNQHQLGEPVSSSTSPIEDGFPLDHRILEQPRQRDSFVFVQNSSGKPAPGCKPPSRK